MVDGGATASKVLIQDIDDGQPCLACDKCPGFSLHAWRNICRHCKCLQNAHDLSRSDFVDIYDRIGLEPPSDIDLQTDRNKALRLGYSWVPAGLSAKQVEDYMEQLDNNKIPKLSSVGTKYHEMQIIAQLPRHDLSVDCCRHLKNDSQQASFNEFVHTRNTEALGVGHVIAGVPGMSVCRNCDGDIEAGEMAVAAAKLDDMILWHAACFTCADCHELLVNLCYCCKDGNIYCERHYAELVRPRCAACDELIFSAEYTKAMDQDWHTSHFACFHCDLSLTGHRYVLRDEHAYCINCYETMFAHTCEECKTVIGTDSKDLSYKELHWHEKCFQCSDCQASLVDRPFATQNSRLYCADCHDNNFAPRCDQCGHIFRAGMKKFEYMGKQWHEQCFCCQECRQPISSKSFIPRDQHVICITCYEQQYAQRCAKCNGVITKGGVTYKNTSWHRDCFTCTHCAKTLAGEKFTSQDDKPYCADCYGELFAKKCDNCLKPITGLGCTKFVSFEDRHWHSDCFVCSQCSVSLVGQGFLLEDNAILCPDCGQA